MGRVELEHRKYMGPDGIYIVIRILTLRLDRKLYTSTTKLAHHISEVLEPATSSRIFYILHLQTPHVRPRNSWLDEVRLSVCDVQKETVWLEHPGNLLSSTRQHLEPEIKI